MSTHDERDDFDSMIERVMGMDDDALDAMVGELSASYNAPPSRAPAEAMWTRIAAAQRPVRLVPHHARWQRWQLLAASVAFLAFGVTIGREWAVRTHAADRSDGAVRTTPSIAPVASSPDTTKPTSVAAAAATSRTEARTTEARTTEVASHPVGTSDGASGEAHVVASTDARSATSDGNDATYRLATVRHFAAAEALLASYDASGKDAKADAQLASWAGDLVAQTRLLLDSPAARDPVRRKLLQDLELVLVQMAQLSPASPRVEHDLIDGSVRHNDILTRLHTAVPAGATTEL
jgi:hypothetical protein